MGAGASKQFHSDKAKHAAKILNAVQNFYDDTVYVAGDDDNFSIGSKDLSVNNGLNTTELFKKRVKQVAADAKLHGDDIEESLAQLSDADIEKLCDYVEAQTKEKGGSLRVEEVIDDEQADEKDGADDEDGNVDETTSVLSYGDDEAPDNESDAVGESSESFQNISMSVKKRSNSRSEDQLDSEYATLHPHGYDEIGRSNDGIAQIYSPVKSVTNSVTSFGIDRNEKVSLHKKSLVTLLDPSALKLNETYAKIWGDSDQALSNSNSITSLASANNFSPTSSQRNFRKDENLLRRKSSKDVLNGAHHDDKNQALMDLQRKKVLSYTQNAQLEREVEELRKQLEKMDQFDLTIPPSNFKATTLMDQTKHSAAMFKGTGTSNPTNYINSTKYNYNKLSPNSWGVSYIYPIEEHVINNSGTIKSISDSKSSTMDRPPNSNSHGKSKLLDEIKSQSSSEASSDSEVSGVAILNTAVAPSKSHNRKKKFASKRETLRNRNEYFNQSKQTSSNESKVDRESDSDMSSTQQPIDDSLSNDSSHKGVVEKRRSDVVRRRRIRSNQLGHAFNMSDPEDLESKDGSNMYSNNLALVGSSLGQKATHPPRIHQRSKIIKQNSIGKSLPSSNTADSDDSGNSAGMSNIPSIQGRAISKSSNLTPTHNARVNGASNAVKPVELMKHPVETNADANPNFIVENSRVNNSFILDNPVRIQKETTTHEGHNTKGVVLMKANRSRRRSHDDVNAENAFAQQQQKELTDKYISNDSRSVLPGGSDVVLPHMASQDTAMDSQANEEANDIFPINRGMNSVQRKNFTNEDNLSHNNATPSRIQLNNILDKIQSSRSCSIESTHDNENKHNNIEEEKKNESKIKVGSILASRIQMQHNQNGGMEESKPSNHPTSTTQISMNNLPHVDDSLIGAVVAATTPRRNRNRSSLHPAHNPHSNESIDVDNDSYLISSKLPPASKKSTVELESLWNDELDSSWIEVRLLLRKPIETSEDMTYTVASAEAGLLFIEQLNEIAKNLHVLRGSLSRWLLPFDSNTRIESQSSTPNSVVENMPVALRGKLTERQVNYLVTGANGVRNLVRIKIADDNDLEQARSAVKTTDKFFKKLYDIAKQSNVSPFDILRLQL